MLAGATNLMLPQRRRGAHADGRRHGDDLVQLRQPLPADLVTFPGSRTVGYGYDDAGRRTSVTCPGGTNQATYAYDNANRLSSVTDWNSRAVAYAYDDAGRMTTATLPASTGIVSSYSYDNADRLTGIAHVQSGSTTVAPVAYTVDAVGNRTQRVDQQGTHTYAYDNLLRARYYDSETGRFVSREPMESVPGWDGNSYGYSACSPATLGDPSGLRPTDGTDDRDRSARQKVCDDIASQLLGRAKQMREDREVIEGRGTGRPVSNDDKKNKQNRWKDYQGAVQALMSRWRRLECSKHIGNGSLPNDIDELEHGEYPKFDSSRWHFPHIEMPDLPDPPDVWWDGDPVNPWDLLPQIGRPLGPQTR